jgi:hypothetical protein
MHARPRRLGQTRQGVSKLLRTVAGEPHASAKDHYENDKQYTPAKLKVPTPVNASPEGSSDNERDPESSSDIDVPISSYDIKSAFHANGTSKASPKQAKASAPPARRSIRRPVADGTDVQRPAKQPKLEKASDDDNLDVFGEFKPKKVRQPGYGSGNVLRAPQQTYAKVNPAEKKKFIRPSTLALTPQRPISKFKNSLPTPASSKEGHRSSQEKADEWEGAEEFLEKTEQFCSVEPPQKSKAAKAKPRLKVAEPQGLSTSPPKSSGPEFVMVESLTQAVKKFDRKEIQKEIEEEDRKERAEREAAAARRPDHGPCPMGCGKILPRSELETLDPQAKVRVQQAFCRSHQVKDAKDEWVLRGYPMIDWDELQKRLKKHNKDIAKMIKEPERLHFRKEMEERNKKGRDRTLLQHMKNEGLEGIGAGYYGPKGHDIMTEHITREFATDIMEKSFTDKIIHGRGATGYIQMVLVLELTTLLVNEDMNNVGDESARSIMRESTSIGDLLHPSESSNSSGRRRRMVFKGEHSDESEA